LRIAIAELRGYDSILDGALAGVMEYSIRPRRSSVVLIRGIIRMQEPSGDLSGRRNSGSHIDLTRGLRATRTVCAYVGRPLSIGKFGMPRAVTLAGYGGLRDTTLFEMDRDKHDEPDVSICMRMMTDRHGEPSPCRRTRMSVQGLVVMVPVIISVWSRESMLQPIRAGFPV